MFEGTKLMNSLADLERHNRAIGREISCHDKDYNYWMWKLTDTDALKWKYSRR